MKKCIKIFLIFAISILALTACTDKSKQDADKLTSDIVDYSQNKVDETTDKLSDAIQNAFNDAKDYVKENAGEISEKIVDGLTDIAKDVKDEAEDIGGAIKDDLSGNVREVIDEVKENIGDGIDTAKDTIDGAKEDVKDAVDNAKEDVKDAVDNVKDKVDEVVEYVKYRFRNYKLLDQHYEKHGKEMGVPDRESYEQAASDVINNPEALHKVEKEDGDYVYYVEATNEFVILSTDGYIRTYFLPSGGKKYYDRQ